MRQIAFIGRVCPRNAQVKIAQRIAPVEALLWGLLIFCASLVLGQLTSSPAKAETAAQAMKSSDNTLGEDQYEAWNAHYQTTYVWQRHPQFRAPYTGANSLTPNQDKSYTFTATVFLGLRPWRDGEIYLNTELVQGQAFTGNLVGLGAGTNGEVTRTAGATLKGYFPRFFLRQTWNLGGERLPLEAAANQLAGFADTNRFVLTVGKFSALDIFDNNKYAKDSRTQFMSAANMTHAAYDYASDARGYSWGFAGEWYQDNWAVRFGRISGPTEPNGPRADYRIDQHYGDQIEIERGHELGGRTGAIRVLAWRNQAHLARFSDALAYGSSVGWVPDPVNGRQYIFNTRQSHQVKYGLGVNVEQELTDDTGTFFRAMWSDGGSETHAFTEVDRSLAAGISMKGTQWKRADDTLGLSVMVNAISADRRRYLEAGGISFFIGDGALRYRPETILETYYSFPLTKGTNVTLDFQRIANPAYNADRGPVNVVGIRLHAEY